MSDFERGKQYARDEYAVKTRAEATEYLRDHVACARDMGAYNDFDRGIEFEMNIMKPN